MGSITDWHRQLARPAATNPNLARKERIFYILLISSLYLAGLAALLTSGSFIKSYLAQTTHHGASPLMLFATILVLLGIYRISKHGHPQLAAYIYLIILWMMTAYTSFHWGALLYQAVLIYALIIIFAGILINTRLSFLVTAITSLFVTVVTYLQSQEIIYSDQLWRQTPPHLGNAIIACFTLGVLAIFSWLSNKEISNSLEAAQKSQQDLEAERNLLEIKINKRTQQLKQAQLETMLQWQRFVDMGKIASGLFHDMRNYLTSLTLDLELDKNQQALTTIKQINNFVDGTQKQLQDENKYQLFNPIKEIAKILDILKHKINQQQIKIIVKSDSEKNLYGPTSVFHQIIINLLTNAIDSYSHHKQKHSQDRQIEIAFHSNRENSTLVIKDFGCGIEPTKSIQVFEPFFTTKTKDSNFGLGLFITKSAIEHHFSGEIKLASELNLGSTFTIIFPHQKPIAKS